jgi:CheY-like chemotaxis protein
MKRVLVVEDDKYLNKLICDYLAIEGFDVKSARDGESAWSILSEEPHFDSLVLDMLLPKVMGAELLSKINENLKFESLQKICISGVYKDVEDIQRLCALHDLQAYLPKPFDLDELCAKLNNTNYSAGDQQKKTGDLKLTSLERLFFQSYCQAFTGSLDLKWEDSSRRIFFLNGHPVSASSSALAENLGAFLVQEAYLDEEQRDQISKKMAKERIFFGEALLSLKLLNKAELYQALRKHTYKILTHCFSTRQGTYHFESLAELPSHLPHIEFNPFLLMLEAQSKQISGAALEALFQIKANEYPHRGPRFFQCLPLCAPGEFLQKLCENWGARETLADWFLKVPLQDREKAQRILYLAESLKMLSWKSEPQESELRAQSFQFDQERERESSEVDPQLDQQIRELYMDALNQNYFELLGVEEEASLEKIESAYREIRFEKHPDRYENALGGESKRILQDYLTRLDKAYQCLIDETRRSEYAQSIFRMSSDSAADSKRYLQAQDLFYQAQKLLQSDKFSEAKLLFDRAAATWSSGVEYRMYSVYTDFRSSKNAKLSEKQALLIKLKELCIQHPHSDVGFLLLGHAHRQLDQISAARDAYQKALALQPEQTDALNALSRLAEREQPQWKLRLPRQIPRRWYRNLFLLLFAVALLVPLWKWKEGFQNVDESVLRPSPQSIAEHFQALQILIKEDVGQVVLASGQVKGIPDAVVRHKCQRSLSLLEAYGASRLYLTEEGIGLAAMCSSTRFQRYK